MSTSSSRARPGIARPATGSAGRTTATAFVWAPAAPTATHRNRGKRSIPPSGTTSGTRVPARRRAPDARLRSLPWQRRFQPAADGLLFLSRSRLPGNAGTGSSRSRVLDGLRRVSRSAGLALSRLLSVIRSFPLQGRHASASCSACHENGVYAGTPADCAACHLDDYNGTTEPNHRAAGFPLDCVECHGTSISGWSGAEFDHPFPITSGRHAGVACSECHQTSDYRVFTCLGCHEQASTNSRHNGISGYAYNSQACYACHPRGSAAPVVLPQRSHGEGVTREAGDPRPSSVRRSRAPRSWPPASPSF